MERNREHHQHHQHHQHLQLLLYRQHRHRHQHHRLPQSAQWWRKQQQDNAGRLVWFSWEGYPRWPGVVVSPMPSSDLLAGKGRFFRPDRNIFEEVYVQDYSCGTVLDQQSAPGKQKASKRKVTTHHGTGIEAEERVWEAKRQHAASEDSAGSSGCADAAVPLAVAAPTEWREAGVAIEDADLQYICGSHIWRTYETMMLSDFWEQL